MERPNPATDGEAPQFTPEDRLDAEDAAQSATKKKFSASEDSYLAYLVSLHGTNDWKKIAWNMRGRTVRQCRERWKYYLEPNINRRGWTKDEDQMLLQKHREVGPKWAQLTVFFKNRTDIDLKNRFHKIERSIRRSERKRLAKGREDQRRMPDTERGFKIAEAPAAAEGDVASKDESQGTSDDYLDTISINRLLNK